MVLEEEGPGLAQGEEIRGYSDPADCGFPQGAYSLGVVWRLWD